MILEGIESQVFLDLANYCSPYASNRKSVSQLYEEQNIPLTLHSLLKSQKRKIFHSQFVLCGKKCRDFQHWKVKREKISFTICPLWARKGRGWKGRGWKSHLKSFRQQLNIKAYTTMVTNSFLTGCLLNKCHLDLLHLKITLDDSQHIWRKN